MTSAQLSSVRTLLVPAANFENAIIRKSVSGKKFRDSGLHLKMKETSKEYTIKIKLPGLTKHDLRLTWIGDVLSLETEKWRGKTYEAFKENFRLGEKIVRESIKTRFRNGVLTILVEKVK